MKIDSKTLGRLRDALLAEGRRPTLVLSPAYAQLTRDGLLTQRETDALRRVDPIAEAMYLMMAADGDATAAEVDVIRGAIRDLTDNGLRSATIDVMLEGYAANAAREGWEARLAIVAGGLAEETRDAETAYTLVAAVALADAEVTLEENELIDRLAELLGLTDERCCELLDEVRREHESPWGAEV
jgi:uncharacterized tellurite resistance protein B-like protein